MERMTRLNRDGSASIIKEALDNGQAARRLACLEDFLTYLQARRTDLPAELERLRRQNAVKTFRFRELMTERMTNELIWDLLRRFGIPDEGESPAP